MTSSSEMSTTPEISVVIPAWNRSGVIGRAIESLLDQDFVGFEVLVADDGSTDGTAEAARRTGDARVRVVELEHRGVSAARNAGAKLTRAPILTFLDSDDEALPGWLRAFARAFKEPGVGLVSCGGRRRSGEDGAEEAMLPERLGPIFQGQRGLFLAGSFAVEREIFEAAGGYDERLAYSENTELAIRLVEACLDQGLRIAAIEEPLWLYRAPASGSKVDARGAKARLEASVLLLERHAEAFARDPRVRALHLAVAGVNAARLGEIARARSFFLDAWKSDLAKVRHALRFALTLVPALARRRWQAAPHTEIGSCPPPPRS